MKFPIKRIRAELEQFLREKHGVEIIYDRGPFHGGMARIYEDKKLLLNRFIPEEEKASIMARAIIEADLDTSTLKKGSMDFLQKFTRNTVILDDDEQEEE